MATLDLTPDQLLTTTRAVRKRLDFSRPVPDDLVRECVAMALQSPSGSNNPTMQFVVVRDEAKRQAIGEVYRQCYAMYKTMDGIYVGSIDKGSDDANAQQRRVASSADYLGDHMGEAPVLVIACTRRAHRRTARPDGRRPSSATCSRPCGASCWRPEPAVSAPAGPRCTSCRSRPWPTSSASPSTRCSRCASARWPTPRAPTSSPPARPDPDTIIHWDTW